VVHHPFRQFLTINLILDRTRSMWAKTTGNVFAKFCFAISVLNCPWFSSSILWVTCLAWRSLKYHSLLGK
jgi:hypothetical protein